MNAIDIKHLTKSYNGTLAVDDVSLSIKPGEFYGFLGPNGAGKTTTIKAITGMARFEGGTIELFGTDVVRDYREARKKVGLSPQDFNVDIFEKTWKILDYSAGYYGMPKSDRQKRVQEVLERFNLEEHKEKKFQELSGGMKRRVMLARAMVHDPDILILDEPTSGVDVQLRHELWDHLRDLNKQGKTILLTSHYLEEVELLCERIGIVNNGKLVAEGTKDEFIREGTLEQKYLKITQGEGW